MPNVFAKVLIIGVILVVFTYGKDRRCCEQCQPYQGLLIEPECQECTKNLYVTLHQEIELQCSPCNATYASQINRSKVGNYFWTFWSLSQKRLLIREEHTTRVRSIVKIKPSEIVEGTLNCYFGPASNGSRAVIQGHKNFVVCGHLVKPTFTCFTFVHQSLNTLAMTCSWSIPNHIDVAMKYGESMKICGFDYGKATLASKLGQNIHDGAILMENGSRSCGIESPCQTQTFCARPACGNGRLSDFTTLSGSTVVIEARSNAQKRMTYDFTLPPARSVFKVKNRPFIVRGMINTDSCTVAINSTIDNVFIKDPKFNVSIKVIDRRSGRILRDGKTSIIVPLLILKRGDLVSVAILLVDGLFAGRLYDFYVNYSLQGSVYTSDTTHLECRTKSSVPVVAPKIQPGGYTLSNGRLVLYTENVPEEQQGSPGFTFEATLKYDNQTLTTTGLDSVSFDINQTTNGSIEMLLRCRNSEGWCNTSDTLLIDASTMNRKPKYVIARKSSKGHDTSQYAIGWSSASNVSTYVMHWCEDVKSCRKQSKWVRLNGSAENVIMCMDSSADPVFFVSACENKQCGPRIPADLKYFDRLPNVAVNTPILDKSTSSLRLSWKPVDDIDFVGFTSSKYEYSFDGMDSRFTQASDVLVPCDTVERGKITSFGVRQIAQAKSFNSQMSPLPCLGTTPLDGIQMSEWTDTILTPEMCRIPEAGRKLTAVVSVVFIMSAVSLGGLICIIYFRYQRMTKKFLQQIMDVIDQVEHTYSERKAAKDDREKLAERWILENYGAPPEYITINGSKGPLRLPIFPRVDQLRHRTPVKISSTNCKENAPVPTVIITPPRNVYAQQRLTASSGATASSDQPDSLRGPSSPRLENIYESLNALANSSTSEGSARTQSSQAVTEDLDDGYRKRKV